jgi:ABC-type antimicrobial peptide transport system permease subunit
MIDGFLQDLRYGARMLAKNPGFTLVAVMSMAIGVGANAAMFSVADGLVFRPLPPGFTGIDHDVKPAFYIPLAMLATVQSGTKPDILTGRATRLVAVKARLAPGVSLAEARLELEQLASNLQQAYPDTNRGRGLIAQTEFEVLRETRGDTNLVVMLLVLALAVLAIACANIAGLMTSRAPDRARELAMRLAVGARRTRVVRQLVTESVLIATGGGALGLFIGYLV